MVSPLESAYEYARTKYGVASVTSKSPASNSAPPTSRCSTHGGGLSTLSLVSDASDFSASGTHDDRTSSAGHASIERKPLTLGAVLCAVNFSNSRAGMPILLGPSCNASMSAAVMDSSMRTTSNTTSL